MRYPLRRGARLIAPGAFVAMLTLSSAWAQSTTLVCEQSGRSPLTVVIDFSAGTVAVDERAPARATISTDKISFKSVRAPQGDGWGGSTLEGTLNRLAGTFQAEYCESSPHTPACKQMLAHCRPTARKF